MNRPERVLDEQGAFVGELASERRVVLRLAGVETCVLEHGDPVVGQQLAQARSHGLDREGRIRPLGTAEMRADPDGRCFPLEQQPQRRQRSFDPRLVRDPASVEPSF